MELRFSEKSSVLYHDIFDYPLTKIELFKWKCSKKIKSQKKVISKNNYYLLDGREKIILSRLKNEKYYGKKFILAKKASRLISKVSTIKFVGITGALSMKNASSNSDIDLMIITKHGLLWTSRLLVYILLMVSGFKIRKPKDKNEKDKLCLNIWLDENDLIWKKSNRNIYSAHEMAQIMPLYNKEMTYEKLIWKNKWILEFWPNAIKISKMKLSNSYKKSFLANFEKIFYKFQYLYMKKHLTREIVTPTKALFHPNNWDKIVKMKLST